MMFQPRQSHLKCIPFVHKWFFRSYFLSNQDSTSVKFHNIVRAEFTRRLLPASGTSWHILRQNTAQRPFKFTISSSKNFLIQQPITREISSSVSCHTKEQSELGKDELDDTQSGKINGGREDEKGPLSQRQKLTRTFAAYGTTGVVFHTCISLASLGTCYTIVSSGVDMVAILEKIGIASKAGLQSTLASGASTFVIAYACHKVFMPVRIFLTVTCTPIIVSKLKKIGILKDKNKAVQK